MGKHSRPYCLTIAGFDPSGGAGVQADIKTFESFEVFGLSVCSALTVQNEKIVRETQWVTPSFIQRQLDTLFEIYTIDFAKIGIIENPVVLDDLINYLIKKNPKIKIIWDPIIKASSGFEFQPIASKSLLASICKKIFLITPNVDELLFLTDNDVQQINQYCHVLLKGGHLNDSANDVLLLNNGEEIRLEADKINNDKHGTGCILSAAILAELSKGESIEGACIAAKKYVEKYLISHQSLLGYHYE